MKNLYNNIYSVLPEEKKKEILENLAKKYNMEILKFETFNKYSKSIFTAIFKYKESEFVFVPGDTVTLGYEGLPKNLSNESLDQLKYFSIFSKFSSEKTMIFSSFNFLVVIPCPKIIFPEKVPS